MDLWDEITGFTVIPNSFIEGTTLNMAEYRYNDDKDPLKYGSDVISPYDCRIYPLSVAGSSIHNGYMYTSYYSEFYGNGYSLYLDWKEKDGWTWHSHQDLVLQTTDTGWNAYHSQNSIYPEFHEGAEATIKWRYRMEVFGLSLSISTSWNTDTIQGGTPILL